MQKGILTSGFVAAFGLASFLFLLSADAQTDPAKPDLTSYDWSVNAKPNLAAQPPPTEIVQSFVTKRFGQPDIGAKYSVHSLAFADLRQSGTLSLVVALDSGGTGGCGSTLIADQVRGKIKSAWIHCMGSPIEISGKPVVVSGKQISGYHGAASCPTEFPVIYGWNGAYVDMSRQFPGYYRKELDYLQHYIASYPGSAHYARGPLPCAAIIEAAAIERYLGISPDAGIGDAIRWSQSKSKAYREMAIDLFGSIGTPRALGYLRAMTGDSDPEVARLAGWMLDDPSFAQALSFQDVGHLEVSTEPQ